MLLCTGLNEEADGLSLDLLPVVVGGVFCKVGVALGEVYVVLVGDTTMVGVVMGIVGGDGLGEGFDRVLELLASSRD